MGHQVCLMIPIFAKNSNYNTNWHTEFMVSVKGLLVTKFALIPGGLRESLEKVDHIDIIHCNAGIYIGGDWDETDPGTQL